MRAKQTCIVLILSVLTLVAAADANAHDLFKHDTEMNLLRFMARTNTLMQQDPARSSDCFMIHIPLINECFDIYQTDLETCNDNADLERSQIEDASLQSCMDLRNRTEQSCFDMSKCQENKSSVDEIECYSNTGVDVAKTYQSVASDASIQLTEMKEKNRVVDHKKEKCTTECRLTFEKRRTEAYDGLNNCLMGNNIPTSSTTSSTPVSSTSVDDTTTD